jgi:drug/metabolite transporter (DMT)-like permease
MQHKNTNTLSSKIKLTASILVWGGSFAANKFAVAEISPITVVWVRFLIGWIIIGIFAYRRGELGLPSRKDALQMAWLGFLGITLNQWMQSSGLVTSEASTTAWIVSTTPVFMALLGWLFLKEKLDWKSAAGILLAGIGVLLVVSKGDFGTMFNGNFGKPGDIIILLSAPVWAIYSVMSNPVLKRHSATKVTFYTLFFGWLLSSMQFLASNKWSDFSQLTATGWTAVIYLGVFCSALAYIFYNDGMQALTSSQVGAYLYLEPLVATLVSAVLLSEQIAIATILGGGLIIFGVWLVNRATTDEADTQPYFTQDCSTD